MRPAKPGLGAVQAPTLCLTASSAGEHLRICPQGHTCCTSEMEENLANRSRAELEMALLDSSRALQAALAAQLRGFDGEWAPGPLLVAWGSGLGFGGPGNRRVPMCRGWGGETGPLVWPSHL